MRCTCIQSPDIITLYAGADIIYGRHKLPQNLPKVFGISKARSALGCTILYVQILKISEENRSPNSASVVSHFHCTYSKQIINNSPVI